MDFRAFHVVAIEVARQAMAEMVENGGKWISAGKWWKMDFRAFPVIPLLLMDICDNHPFDQTEEKISRLEELLNVPIIVFEVSLLPEYDDNSKDKNGYFASSQIYSHHKSTNLLSLCILNDTRFMVSRDSDIIP